MAQSNGSERRRRPFQFRLLTFLVVILVGGVTLGWLGRSVRTGWERRRARERFSNAFEKADWELLHSEDMIACMRFGNPSVIRDEHLVHLKVIPMDGFILEKLSLGGTAITDAGLVHLQHMPTLKFFDLGYTAISDAGLRHLKGFAHLRVLDLNETNVSDAALEELLEFGSFETLYLDGANITDAGLVHLGRMKNLRTLTLRRTKITDAGLEHLLGLSQPRFLHIGDTQCTHEGRERMQRAFPSCRVGWP